MNRDEIEGKAEALKGKVKQAAGDLTNNPDLHDEGVRWLRCDGSETRSG